MILLGKRKKTLKLSTGIKEVCEGKNMEAEMNMRLKQGAEQREMIVQMLNKQERKETICKTEGRGASLVAQGLRICLPMQGTRVRSLVWEDPTCHGATRPVSHSY